MYSEYTGNESLPTSLASHDKTVVKAIAHVVQKQMNILKRVFELANKITNIIYEV